MITPTDMLQIVSAGMELFKIQQPTLPHNVSRVFVPFLRQHGTIKRATGNQLDIMLDNGTFIQTTARSLGKHTIEEESSDFPLNTRSNKCETQSPASEKQRNSTLKQLPLF